MTQAVAMMARQAGRAPRWLWAALFTSLAINLVVVGLVVGAVWRLREPPGPGVMPSLLGYTTTLPTERRTQLWAEAAAERAQLRPLRRAVRTARDAAVKAFGLRQQAARYRQACDQLSGACPGRHRPARAIAAIVVEQPLELGQRHVVVGCVRHVSTLFNLALMSPAPV